MRSFVQKYWEVCLSTLTLVAALMAEAWLTFEGAEYLYFSLYGISYLAVGGPVWIKAFKSIRNGTIFSEFLLMGIATVGAFALGEYTEGVAVMLFYMIGEYAQGSAVRKARSSIQSLMDQQPELARVQRAGGMVEVHPSEVQPGERIQVRPGEKVPLDGRLKDERAAFNTSALTGESKPMTRLAGEEIWAGSINQDTPVWIEVTKGFEDTKLAGILHMVEEATARKAPTQRFITKFAKVYTPIVVWLAVALTFLPYFIVDAYVFEEWFYRALIFLVVSCPCGLVISIPLGYFGGIGAASQNGILLKGSDYLDQLRKMDTLFLDKTGTLTEGKFEVQDVSSFNGIVEEEVMSYVASLEAHSNHPIAKAVRAWNSGLEVVEVERVKEVAGKGMKGRMGAQKLRAGNAAWFKEEGIELMQAEKENGHTYVHLAIDGKHVGTVSISDRLKDDAKEAILGLRKAGVKRLVMLSGDNKAAVADIAEQLGLDEALGGLLPEDKYEEVSKALSSGHTIGFVGDGVNDAPVITLSDVGIAMGGIGSDVTVETADVVIQTDQPSKIPLAIEIANFTHKVVWQNIGFALGIKVLVMFLATIGLASMWEAIFADVGVALIAIANAIRVQGAFGGGFSIRSLLSSAPQKTEDTEPASACCCT